MRPATVYVLEGSNKPLGGLLGTSQNWQEVSVCVLNGRNPRMPCKVLSLIDISLNFNIG